MAQTYATADGGLGAQAVAYAAGLVGVPYLWGGKTPKGFDCSGLVQYVYNHFGVSLPGTSQAQAKTGTVIDRSQLQAGDLLFFNTNPNDPSGLKDSHVAIYTGLAGNQAEIAAPHTGANVRYQAIDWTHFDKAVRVAGGSSVPGVQNANFPIPGVDQAVSAISGFGETIKNLAIVGPFIIGGGALVVWGIVKAARGES
ncbi:MAG: hypothetical protein JWP34_4567 [Massilia sp.]|nr:hypothetical protein [Massilia sp.]